MRVKRSIVVGVADMAVSNDVTTELVTYSLGSCLGVVIYDATVRVGGLLHLMLPESSIDKKKARECPAMFVDTGVPLLFQRAYQLGANKSRIKLRVVGGAGALDEKFFNIGRRNYAALLEILDHNGVAIHAEAVGGQVSRTIRLDISMGALQVYVPGSGKFIL